MVVFWLDPGASAIRTVMESFIELPAARRAPSEAAAARSSRRERTVAIEHCTSRSNGVILLKQAIHVKLRPHYPRGSPRRAGSAEAGSGRARVTGNRSGNLSIDATRDAENCEPKGWNRCTLNAADRTRLKTQRCAQKWDRFPYGTEFVGNGVVPDVKFARTKRD